MSKGFMDNGEQKASSKRINADAYMTVADTNGDKNHAFQFRH